MYLICHLTSQDHLIEESFEFLCGRSSQYDTILTGLVTTGIVIVEIESVM